MKAALSFAAVLFVAATFGAWASPGDREAQIMLTDGVRAAGGAGDAAWLTFYGDADSLPRTSYGLGEFCFWGSGHGGQTKLLKEANILGVGVELGWFALQGKEPKTEYNLWGLEDRINYYAKNGFTVAAQLGYTPGWANGLLRKSFPPNEPVEQEIVEFAGESAVLAHSPVITNLPLWYPVFVTPYPVPTTRRAEEVITTNFVPDPQFDENSPRTSKSPIIVGSEDVWVDEGKGKGWERWERVDNIFNAPDGAKVYQINRLGVVRFKPKNVWYHGVAPADGSKVKISYDSIDTSYQPGADYTFDMMTGKLTRRAGEITGHTAAETFDSPTLNSKWKWMNPPPSSSVNKDRSGHLDFAVKSIPSDGVGHFLYQSISGSGDFSATAKLSRSARYDASAPKPFAHAGIMVYQDERNWFRYGLTNDQGRPYLTRCVNGVKTSRGADGTLGWMVTAPRYVTVRKSGNSYTVYTAQQAGADGPDGGYQASLTFEQPLRYPLKVGISSAGNDPAGVAVDEFRLDVPRIGPSAKVAVFYNYLQTDAWIRYVKDVVGHFKDRIKYWQSWNEPDMWMFWSGGQELHAVMQRQFHDAVRSVDPTAYVIGGGYANGGNHHIETVYRIAGRDCFDFASWHPYLFSNRAPDALGWEIAAHQRARDIMASYGDGGKEVFFGELASDSGVLQCGGGMNDRKQADYGLRMLMQCRGLGWVRSVQWWPSDGDLAPVGEKEDDQYGPHGGLFYHMRSQQRDIAGISRVNGKVTLQVTNHIDVAFAVGDKITVSGIPAPHDSFNGDFVVSGIEEVFSPIFNSSKKVKITYAQDGKGNASAAAPDGKPIGVVKSRVVPKPVYWAYRNLASNRGIFLDLCGYDSESRIVPEAGRYSIASVSLGVLDRSRIASVRVLTSLTATDASSRPDRVAARHIGSAGATPMVVRVDSASRALKTEEWTVTATSAKSFTVKGSVSGSQGVATVGVPFTSQNRLVSFTLQAAAKPYAAGDRFVFETFAGDGFTEQAVWRNGGTVSGRGDITISFPSPVDARYAAIEITRASGLSFAIDEVEVRDAAGALVSAGKLYVADGYQEFFRDNPSEPVSVEVEGMPETLTPGTTVTLSVDYTNSSSSPASNMLVRHQLPEKFDYVEGSATGGGIFDAASRELRWVIPYVAGGGTGKVSFSVVVR